jgi:hypothetical protein
MKKLLITVVLFILCTWTFAQDASLAWAKPFAGWDWTSGRAIVVDAGGNIYTTGDFEGDADLDPGADTTNHVSYGDWDSYVSKLDPSGNYVWSRQMGGMSQEKASGIGLDGSGNIYTAGFFTHIADFDPGTCVFNLTSADSSIDIYLSKLDAAGNFVWAIQFGGEGDDEVHSLATDAAGNVYLTGYFNGAVDFDPGAGMVTLTANGLRDVFVAKYDPSGDLVWARRMGGVSAESGRGIQVDAFGNVYVVGEFNEVVDFDPGVGSFILTSAGYSDVFVSKLNSAGNFVWAKHMGGPEFDRGNSIALDGSGNIYALGSFKGTADFDPGAGTTSFTSGGNEDIFIEKLNPSGNMIWARQIGGGGYDFGDAITVEAFSGDVYFTGSFDGIPDFDPGAGTYSLVAEGLDDMYICKLSTAGDFVWAKQMGGFFAMNKGLGIVLDMDRNIITTGRFSGYTDFDPDSGTVILGTTGHYDAFVHKMTQSGLGVGEDDFEERLKVYPQPSGGRFTVDLGELRQKVAVSLLDIHGRILERLEFKSAQMIPMEWLGPAGVYLLKVEAGENKAVMRVIME